MRSWLTSSRVYIPLASRTHHTSKTRIVDIPATLNTTICKHQYAERPRSLSIFLSLQTSDNDNLASQSRRRPRHLEDHKTLAQPNVHLGRAHTPTLCTRCVKSGTVSRKSCWVEVSCTCALDREKLASLDGVRKWVLGIREWIFRCCCADSGLYPCALFCQYSDLSTRGPPRDNALSNACQRRNKKWTRLGLRSTNGRE